MDCILICGDFFIEHKNIGDNSIDLVVTSPPYGVAKDYETNDPERQLLDTIELTNKSFEIFKRIVKPGGYVFWNFGDNGYGKKISKTEVLTTIPMSVYVYPAGVNNGFELQATRIWKKAFNKMAFPFFLNHQPRPVFEYEHLWTWRKPDGVGKQKVNNHSFSRHAVWSTDGYNKEEECYIGHSDKHIKNVLHCAPFPIEIPEKAITLYSDEGMLVLDPFMGSGTTGVACKKLNRNFIGIEINKDYFDIANNRIHEYKSNLCPDCGTEQVEGIGCSNIECIRKRGK